MLERFGDTDTAHSEIGNHLAAELKRRFKLRPVAFPGVARNIGNEIRSADPHSSDIVLTRDLGYAATRFLMEGGTNAMVTLKAGSLQAIPFSDFVDTENASAHIRPVDVNTLAYQVSQSYMIVLKTSDLHDVVLLQKMARGANMTPQDFIKTFGAIALPPNQITWTNSNSGISVANNSSNENANSNTNIIQDKEIREKEEKLKSSLTLSNSNSSHNLNNFKQL